MPIHCSSRYAPASVAQQKGAANAAPSVFDNPAGSERDPGTVPPIAAAAMLAPDEMLAVPPAPAVGMDHQAPFRVIVVTMAADVPAFAGPVADDGRRRVGRGQGHGANAEQAGDGKFRNDLHAFSSDDSTHGGQRAGGRVSSRRLDKP